MTWELVIERRQAKRITTLNDFIGNANPKANAGNRRTIREWRTWARAEADRLGLVPVDDLRFPLVVEVIHLHAARIHADAGAAYVLGKAVVDGLHDEGEFGQAKVIPGDDGRYVRGYWVPEPVVVRPDRKGHANGVRVVLHESTWLPPRPDVLPMQVPASRVHTPAGGVTLDGTPLIVDQPSPSHC